MAGSRAELSPNAIEQATHLLVRYLGPISAVLTKRAVPHADSLRSLYLLLAEHIESESERASFLREAGIPDISPPTKS